MKCTVCNTREAITHKMYGILPCSQCSNELTHLAHPSRHLTELTSETVKEDRKSCADDILQPFRGGYPSKEFVDKYGTDGIHLSEYDKKNIRPVWREDAYYNE